MMAVPFDFDHVFRLIAGPRAASSLFAYLCDGLRKEIGSGLTTASVYDLDNMRSRRVYSDDLDAYPVSNFKRLDKNLYFDIVIAQHRHFASTTIEQIAEVFFDYDKIRALGFESNLNIPAVADNQVIGTVNLLGPKGHFTYERVEKALRWQPVVTLAFLMLWRDGRENATFLPEGTVRPTGITEGGD